MNGRGSIWAVAVMVVAGGARDRGVGGGRGPAGRHAAAAAEARGFVYANPNDPLAQALLTDD